MGESATSRARRRGGEPLPLQLPDPPALPGRLKPEAAVPCSSPFDADGWRFSVDWDGSRTLLFADDAGRVRLQSETLSDVTDSFPEIAACGAALGGKGAVLDGVIAVLDAEGRPNLPALGERLRLGRDGAQAHPGVFLATDLLHLEAMPLLTKPLDRRLAALTEVLLPDPTIQLPDDVIGNGLALAEACRTRSLPALLARRGAAPYRCGVASPDRLRLALADRTTCVVTAAEPSLHRSGEVRIALGEYLEGRLVDSGAVVVRLAAEAVAWLEGLSPGLATVAFAGRDSGGWLRDPELIAIRNDIDPLWCQRRDAVPPPDGTAVTTYGFRPTVITALPMPD